VMRVVAGVAKADGCTETSIRVTNLSWWQQGVVDLSPHIAEECSCLTGLEGHPTGKTCLHWWRRQERRQGCLNAWHNQTDNNVLNSELGQNYLSYRASYIHYFCYRPIKGDPNLLEKLRLSPHGGIYPMKQLKEAN
jgi:hypothetical protein